MDVRQAQIEQYEMMGAFGADLRYGVQSRCRRRHGGAFELQHALDERADRGFVFHDKNS
jgi:hypothetical protein